MLELLPKIPKYDTCIILQDCRHIRAACFAVLPTLHLCQPNGALYPRAHDPSHSLCSPAFFSHH